MWYADNNLMLIIFGFRVRASKVSEGEFFCPRCGADRHYVLQRFRRWFTLFFLPVFPMSGSQGEQVKCQTCNAAFRPEILQAPTSARLSDAIRDTMRLAAVVMLRAGNSWDTGARQAAIDAIVSTGADGYDDGNLTQDQFGSDGSQLAAQVGQLAPGLNDQGKEMFVSQLARIAVADGPVDENEQAVLNTVGAGLGMSAAHVFGIASVAANTPRY